MKLVLDDILEEELKTYLLTQKGITNVELKDKNLISEINIKYDEIITPKIIMEHIYLFQKNQMPIMLEFDKKTHKNTKKLRYIVDDMCCEYCYKGLVQDLFENEFIVSVKSNFSFNKPAFNIELLIEYDAKYDETKLINYIKEKI